MTPQAAASKLWADRSADGEIIGVASGPVGVSNLRQAVHVYVREGRNWTGPSEYYGFPVVAHVARKRVG